jgi:hypothetical protein
MSAMNTRLSKPGASNTYESIRAVYQCGRLSNRARIKRLDKAAG